MVFARWKEKMRQRHDPAVGFSNICCKRTMDNVDADLLAAVYNPSHPDFSTLISAARNIKISAFVLLGRCVPQLNSPEEVGLINVDPEPG